MKKLMKSVAMVALAAATLSIVGCGAATPEKVAVNFVEKIYHDGDFDGAAKLCTKKTAPLIDYYTSVGILKNVDGSGSLEEISNEIFKTLEAIV